MFTEWSLYLKELAERAVFQQPATYFTEAALQEHWRVLDFPSRKLRQRPAAADLAAFRASGGGSIPRLSASKTQDRRPAERQRARTNKNHQPWVSHVDGSAYIEALIEFVFEAVSDSSLQCDCFGLLMRQWHILKGASRHVHQGGAFVR